MEPNLSLQMGPKKYNTWKKGNMMREVILIVLNTSPP
jgi:hypothetical protein